MSCTLEDDLYDGLIAPSSRRRPRPSVCSFLDPGLRRDDVPTSFQGLQKQRGAATVIAAMLLVTVVLTIGLATQRLSSTDVIDSSLQRHAVEALFLAETGLENAAQQLANGTGCSSLVMGSPIGFGNGDFQITAASLAGSLCTVRVTGRLLYGSSVQASRTLEGDIQLPGSGSTWAVGRNGTALNYDGSGWTSYTPSSQQLNDVTCPTSTCYIVGNNGELLSWNGSAWNSETSGTGNDLNDISCEPGNDSSCFAVGDGGVIRYGGAGGWAASNSTTTRNLYGVYCDTGFCLSVGRSGTVRRWTGGTNWSFEWALTSRDLNDVACTPSQTCFAVGRNGTILVRTLFGFFGYIWFSTSSGTSRHLNGISCPTDTRCYAVGNNGTIATWNGSSWNASSSGTHLYDVDCEDNNPNNCVAVGRNGTILQWNGSTWSDISGGITTRNLNGVTVGSGSAGGSLGLVGWREINA